MCLKYSTVPGTRYIDISTSCYFCDIDMLISYQGTWYLVAYIIPVTFTGTRYHFVL